MGKRGYHLRGPRLCFLIPPASEDGDGLLGAITQNGLKIIYRCMDEDFDKNKIYGITRIDPLIVDYVMENRARMEGLMKKASGS